MLFSEWAMARTCACAVPYNGCWEERLPGSQPHVDIENILVVDDEEAIREVVSTMLESKGYHCTAVSNGRAPQDQVKRTTPDLVLSDMIMPEMDGIKLLQCLLQYRPEGPLIMGKALHPISSALYAILREVFD